MNLFSALGGKILMTVFVFPPGAEVSCKPDLAFRPGRTCYAVCFYDSALGGMTAMIVIVFPPRAEAE